MRLLFLVAAVSALAGCDMPGRDFLGLPAQRIAAGGHVFDIRIAGRRAEAIRLDVAAFPRFAGVARAAEIAIMQASGCVPVQLAGDPSVIRAQLDCTPDQVSGFSMNRLEPFSS
ncbi:MAG: hypothetical protein ACLFRU_02150 [Paracoccaceae bacterium]